jgi:hypothetical protein
MSATVFLEHLPIHSSEACSAALRHAQLAPQEQHEDPLLGSVELPKVISRLPKLFDSPYTAT